MPGGRPPKYKEEYAKQAYNYSFLGATDAQLATFFDVREKTINNWKEKFPEFLQSLKRGKLEADTQITKSLFQRALGYSHQEVKLFFHEGDVIEHEVTKHYAPDPTSMIFWLKNRQPEIWRDRIQQKVDTNVIIDFSS